ncbi:kynureninase, partial [Rickenella mellea]
DEPCTYLCGNSLGALPKLAKQRVEEELQTWGNTAVEAHFTHPLGRPWMNMVDLVNPLLAELLGAQPNEVACMGTLTANLHLMMASFYRPTQARHKILCEARAFPSDQYAFASQAASHGYDPREAVLELSPREGEYTLRVDDIMKVIKEQGKEIALVIFSGVQYYTGQVFPMEDITKAAHAQGCVCAWDLAHAIGNVPLALHDWGVDFAVYCTYKYLNSGPGGIGGLFIHEKWADSEKPKQAGWWGQDPETRFLMPPTFTPIRGAQGFQQSNPSVLALAALLGSLQVFKQAGMIPALRKRALGLTSKLANLLIKSRWYVPAGEVNKLYPESSSGDTKQTSKPAFTIITPLDPEERGTQLSLLFLPTDLMPIIFKGLMARGVVGDMREPGLIRLSPIALYNTDKDVETAARSLDEVFGEI